MPLTRRNSVIWGLTSFLTCKAWAQSEATATATPSGLDAPAYLKQFLATPRCVGQGSYSLWGFDIYQATLWSEAAALTPDNWSTQTFALELRYARDFHGKDIAKRSLEEMHMQSPLAKEKGLSWLKVLEEVFPNVHKNETLCGVYMPGKGTQFLYNEKIIGIIRDLELCERFFAIWLSPKTSAKNLRKALFSIQP